ncbi:hypothetical protein F2Q70_00024819 [Brassica cretica]|uniref:PPIase cyclophilin-type domain-containing protein n=1 Tax=Brassica cretica TaxID=69181 RepID=A0A8S9LEX5_BRACR|nr:hypothetical protein F2Q70_00024819 [Brassica cretica]
MSSGVGGGGRIVAAPTAAASAAPSSGGGNVEWHVRPPNPKSPVVFFDVSIGGIPAGRIKMELFADIAPKTSENFSAVVTHCKFFFFDVQRVLGDGLLVVRKIENVAVGPNNRPKLSVVITECGEM